MPRAIALWFNRKRGLALGFAGSAQALGAFVIPVFGQKIIAQHGWSTALLALAAFEIVVCLPLVAWLVKDSPAPYGLHPDGAAPVEIVAAEQVADPGMEVGAIIRTVTFWRARGVFWSGRPGGSIRSCPTLCTS